MYISPDDIGAAVGGLIVMLGAVAVIVGKAWTALTEIKKQTGEITRQTGPNGENAARIEGKRAADTSTEVLSVLGDMRAEQGRQSGRLHALETGLGGLRDDIRNDRRHADEVAEAHDDEITELRRSLSACQQTHITGLDYRDHVTPHTQEES